MMVCFCSVFVHFRGCFVMGFPYNFVILVRCSVFCDDLTLNVMDLCLCCGNRFEPCVLCFEVVLSFVFGRF